jgi:hypothetical protein
LRKSAKSNWLPENGTFTAADTINYRRPWGQALDSHPFVIKADTLP